MALTDPYMQYRQNAAQTAAPGELTMMLFNGLVRFIKQAITSLEQKDYSGSHKALVRSQEILAYLNETLDPRFELSKNMSALYHFMSRKLMEANIKKDVQNAGEVLELADELRKTWWQALKLARETGL